MINARARTSGPFASPRARAAFLCPLHANIYGIEFLSFVITDFDSKKTIFEARCLRLKSCTAALVESSRPQVSRDRPLPMDFDIAALDEDSLRKINYEFSEDVLKLPKIMTT